MGLTDENIARIMSRRWQIGHSCPECRNQCTYNVLRFWTHVMDRFDEFTDEQRAALSFAKQNDRDAEVHMKERMEGHPLKQFTERVLVKLHGLKGKKEWNGKTARIIGKG